VAAGEVTVDELTSLVLKAPTHVNTEGIQA